MPEDSNKIELPRTLPKKQELKVALGVFYDSCKNKQWFYRAEIVENHPTHMADTLVIFCKYNPVLEMKDILQFTDQYKVGFEIVPLSHQDIM